MDIDIVTAADLFRDADRILLLAHKSPDGDTLGSCFALYWALAGLGKQVRVECSDPFPKRYGYFYPEQAAGTGQAGDCFEPEFTAAVDVADCSLLGERLSRYADNIQLCVDHHPSNSGYAQFRVLRPTAAATAELALEIIRAMGAETTSIIADALFTGMATDTGCFRYANVTPRTHRYAADLMEAGANAGEINRVMFEEKSRRRIEMERLVMETLRFDFDGRCASILVSRKMREETGASEDELEGLSAIPRAIEGVWIGVTFQEREEGCKLSVRTNHKIDASAFCRRFGGGGHYRAGGCVIQDSYAGALQQVLRELSGLLDAPE